MKKILYLWCGILVSISFNMNCFQFDKPLESVVAGIPSMLVIEAGLIDTNNVFRIRITETTQNIINTNDPGVTLFKDAKYIPNASVSIFDYTNKEYKFAFTQTLGSRDSGSYTTPIFPLVLGKDYKLRVVYNNETYESVIQPIDPPIVEKYNFIAATNGTSTYNVSFTLRDKIDVDNYYIGYLYRKIRRSASHRIIERTAVFTNSQQISNGGTFPFDFSSKPALNVGDTLLVRAISFSSVQGKIVTTFTSIGSNPFQPQPAYPRSNIQNVTTPTKKCLGYFSINSYTFQKFVRLR